MRYFICGLSILLLCGTSLAEKPPKLTVATGRTESTHHQVYKELGKSCAHIARWMEVKTDRGYTSLELLEEDEVDLVFLQGDILKSLQLTGEMKKKNIDILVPLYIEDLHLISKKDNLLSLIDRKRIAAFGGSDIVSDNIKRQLNLHYKIITYNNSEDAMSALERDKVDLVMAMTGQPAKWIMSLSSNKYTLIPFPHINNSSHLDLLYKKSSLSSYKHLSKGTVPTIAMNTKSAIIAKGPYTSEQQALLLKYQKCAIHNLQKLQSLPSSNSN